MSADHPTREFDKRRFRGRWKVVAGEIPPDPQENDFVILRQLDEERFLLRYERGQRPHPFRQHLFFNERTKTLDSREDGKPQRCVSFWDRQAANEKNCIFAIRRGRGELLPWENPENEAGTWGAEPGG